MAKSLKVSIPQLTEFVVELFLTVGLEEPDSRKAADVLVTTDAMGVFTHGTKLLIGYLRKIRGGGYSATAKPRVEREGPAWAIVDGESALGMVGCLYALEVAMEKARKCGVAYCGLRNTGHVGAIGYYAAVAARAGFVTTAMGNDIPSVAVPGSTKAVLGSNPLAYGIPRLNHDPILLDIATAAVAGGKVYAAHQRGEEIPPHWLIGPDGKPTTDGSLYPSRASLAPMGGHKGYGIGLWCEILSGVLPGGHITWQVGSWMFDEPTRPSWHNAAFMLVDVAAMGDRDLFDSRLEKLIDEIHHAPTASPEERVMLPGEREWESYDRSKAEGISLPQDVVEKLVLAAEFCNAKVDWLTQ